MAQRVNRLFARSLMAGSSPAPGIPFQLGYRPYRQTNPVLLDSQPMKTTPSSLKAAILLAFADCHGTEAERDAGYATRNLSFRAAGPVPRDTAFSIMDEALGGSTYNAFEAKLLRKLPDHSQVTIAREGSVCVYVKGRVYASAKALKADEFDYNVETDETRIWWD